MNFIGMTVNKNVSHNEVKDEEKAPAINPGESVSNCHPECNGCSESQSAAACFTCKHFTQALRNRIGFKCVSRCEDGFYADGDKCKKCGSNCVTCSQAEKCTQCHGSLLLIETHTQRIDQGQCVSICPLGLRADYSHAVQGRCLIKASFCENGYYEGIGTKCQPCDEACKTCHGPGPLECLECSAGYGNGSTMGYCRPCCKGNDTPESTQHHCEDCTKLNVSNEVEPSAQFGHILLTSLFVLLIGFACYYCCTQKIWALRPVKSSNLDYTPLKTEEERKCMEFSDEEDDMVFEQKHVSSL